MKTHSKIKSTIIRTFGLKGSWKWAKKQMLKGKIVRCKHWHGALKLKIDSKENTMLLFNFTNTPIIQHDGESLWNPAIHHLAYEDYTDYTVFEWYQ